MKNRAQSLRQRMDASHSGFATLLLTCLAGPIASAHAQTGDADSPYAVVEKGAFYRVWQKIVNNTNSVTGQITQEVHSYTELGDGMHFWRDGAWVESRDVVQITATGAEATEGPMKAKFSSDITRIGAISLTTAAGDVFRSRPLGLFYFDSASQKVARIAPVQSGEALLYPPNVIVFSNMLSGVSADLMVVWAHNGYEQNLVLKQRLPSPESLGLSSGTTRLQWWTAMDSCPTPQRQRTFALKSGLVDHILDFMDCWFPVGSAFAFGSLSLPPTGEALPVRLMDPSAPDSVPVAKSLVNINGLTVLIEELNWNELLPMLSGLPQAATAPPRERAVELADRGRLIPKSGSSKAQYAPVQLASGPYAPKGMVIDYYTLTGSASSQIFAANSTYFIPTSFTVTSSATFNQNACIKLGVNASLMLSEASVSFPATGPVVIFTSKDDNSYGDKISGSTSEPGYAAAKALWVYNRLTATTVRNALFRWAQHGIHYTEETGANLHPALNSTTFENCSTGVYLDIGNDTLYLSGDTYCNVPTPISIITGYVYGSMTANCGSPTVSGPVNVSMVDGFDGEAAVAVNPVNPLNLFVAGMHSTDANHFTINAKILYRRRRDMVELTLVWNNRRRSFRSI